MSRAFLATVGLAAALGCAVPQLGAQLNDSELKREHSVYRIDWRAEVAPATENGPIDLLVSRYAPLEGATPVVALRQTGPKAEVVAAGSNGSLKAFSLRGKKLWEFRAGGLLSSPTADRGRV